MAGNAMGPGPMLGIPPLAARSDENLQNARFAAGTVLFRASTPGTYDYVCQVPGHPRDGMCGRIVVDWSGNPRKPDPRPGASHAGTFDGSASKVPAQGARLRSHPRATPKGGMSG